MNNEQGTGASGQCVNFIIKFVFTAIVSVSTTSAYTLKMGTNMWMKATGWAVLWASIGHRMPAYGSLILKAWGGGGGLRGWAAGAS